MREQSIIQQFEYQGNRILQLNQQVVALTNVMKEIVGKELLRGQALHKVLMDKGLFTDAELKVALETLMTEAKAELEAEQVKAKEEKQKAVEILIPSGANIQAPEVKE